MELLKQPQGSPYAMAEQVAILFMAAGGQLMEIERPKVSSFIKKWLEYLRSRHGQLLAAITASGETGGGLEQELSGAVELFIQSWKSQEEKK